jgi:hypothetical protein
MVLMVCRCRVCLQPCLLHFLLFLSHSVVGVRLSAVIDGPLYMLVVDVCHWLSGDGCRVLTVDCQVALSVVVVGSGCRVLVVDCLCRIVAHFFHCRCPPLLKIQYVDAISQLK